MLLTLPFRRRTCHDQYQVQTSRGREEEECGEFRKLCMRLPPRTYLMRV
jgi:hypothetical protein